MKPDSCTNYPSSQQSSYNNGTNGSSNRIRVIRLRRRSNVPLGFSVRGGREHGTGIYVSEVRAGSEAHHQGLLVGDQILRINGFNIEHAIHDEVLALLRAKPGVVIKVKSMGMIPVKDTKKDPLTWKIVEPGPTAADFSGVSSRTTTEDDSLESRISIPSIGSSGLGCSIVKGPPEIPGIYVQSVKIGSLAEKAGLQVGDRILEMNGNNFTNLDFPEAVAILKSSKQMSLVLLKGVGLDLFPEEKMRRFIQPHPKQDDRKLSSVQEEDSRDERNAKKMNGHNARVKNGSDPKHQTDGELKLNGNSSCSDSDVSSQQLSLIQDGVPLMKHGHSVKVRATVHSSSGEDETHSFVRKCTRESGDGMDFESLNGNRQLRRFASWDNVKYETDQKPVHESSESVSEAHDASWEEDSCSSSQSSCREGFKSGLANGHGYVPNADYARIDKNSFASDEKSELSSLSSDDYLGIPKIAARLSRNGYEPASDECVKPQNEFLKRKQHELLMEEFREVHKKMFGHGPPKTLAKTHKPVCNDLQDQASLYKRRQQVRKDRITPPPPPPPDGNSSLEKSEVHSQNIQSELEEKFCDIDEKVKKIVYRKRQREPPITDSRDLDPKPPEIYFDRPEGGPKPLVTIGTYSNTNQQNRFLSSTNGPSKEHQKLMEVKSGTTTMHAKCELDLAIHQRNTNSPSSSTAPSSSSSEPRSPTSESVLSGDSLFKTEKTNSDENVPPADQLLRGLNTFQSSLSQFSKTSGRNMEEIKKNKVLPNKSERSISLPKLTQRNCQDVDPSKEAFEKEAEGRVIKTLVLKKNGPLNFTVEGGINSNLAGKIIVSDVWSGSCATEGGVIERGDQILMVDTTRLTGLSLIAANVALRNANSNTNKEMTLVITKGSAEK